MVNRQTQNKVYGSPLYTFKPVVSAGDIWVEDFEKNPYQKDKPFDFCHIVNNSISSINVSLDAFTFEVLENQTISIPDRYFRNIKVWDITNDIAENDLIITIQKQGMTADLKAREDYIRENSMGRKILNALPILKGLR